MVLNIENKFNTSNISPVSGFVNVEDGTLLAHGICPLEPPGLISGSYPVNLPAGLISNIKAASLSPFFDLLMFSTT